MDNASGPEGYEHEFFKFYNERIRPLETKEFNQWWEAWYGPESDMPEGLIVEYLSEKRFALMGWRARVHPDIREGKDFLQILLNRQKAWRQDCESKPTNTCQTR